MFHTNQPSNPRTYYFTTASLAMIDFGGDDDGHKARGGLFHVWRNPPRIWRPVTHAQFGLKMLMSSASPSFLERSGNYYTCVELQVQITINSNTNQHLLHF